MAISNDLLIKNYLSGNSKKGKSVSFNYLDKKLFMGKIVIAEKYKTLLLINNGLDTVTVNTIREKLFKQANCFNFNTILVPMHCGEEEIPDINIVRSRLNSKLKYWSNNTTELVNPEIRQDFKNCYLMYKTLLVVAFTKARVYYKYTMLYNNLNNEKYIKTLKKKIVHIKAFQK